MVPMSLDRQTWSTRMVWDGIVREFGANVKEALRPRCWNTKEEEEEEDTKFVEIGATHFFISSNDEIPNILEPTLIEVIGNKAVRYYGSLIALRVDWKSKLQNFSAKGQKMRRLSRGRGLPAKGVLADGIPKAKANSTAVDTSFTRKLSWIKMLFLGEEFADTFQYFLSIKVVVESPSLFYDLMPLFLIVIMFIIELCKKVIYYEFIVTKQILGVFGIDIMKSTITRSILLYLFPNSQNCVLMYEPILNFAFYFSSFIFGIITRNRIHYIDDYVKLSRGGQEGIVLNNCQYTGTGKCNSLRAYYGYKNPVGSEKGCYYCFKHKEGRTEEIKNRFSPASLLWKSIFIIFLFLELVIPGYTLLYWNLVYLLGQLFIVRTLNPDTAEVFYIPQEKGAEKGVYTVDYFHERNPRKHELF